MGKLILLEERLGELEGHFVRTQSKRTTVQNLLPPGHEVICICHLRAKTVLCTREELRSNRAKHGKVQSRMEAH